MAVLRAQIRFAGLLSPRFEAEVINTNQHIFARPETLAIPRPHEQTSTKIRLWRTRPPQTHALNPQPQTPLTPTYHLTLPTKKSCEPSTAPFPMPTYDEALSPSRDFPLALGASRATGESMVFSPSGDGKLAPGAWAPGCQDGTGILATPRISSIYVFGGWTAPLGCELVCVWVCGCVCVCV